MYRKFITTIAAASIALTAFGSVPAVAGERETANAIAAILGLAVVGKLIHDRNEKKQVNNHQPTRHKPQHIYKQPKPTYQVPHYNHPKPRPLPQRANRKLLPKQCMRSLDTHRGKVRMFGQRCLQRKFEFAHRLPQQCQYIFNTRKGARRGYEARCLRDRGYRLARR